MQDLDEITLKLQNQQNLNENDDYEVLKEKVKE